MTDSSREFQGTSLLSEKTSEIIIDSPDQLLPLAKQLKDKGYDHVISLSAVDYPKSNELHLVIHISSYTKRDLQPKVFELRVKLKKSEPKVPSLINIWPSVEFQEREAYEMFGIVFEGHPDLRNILLDQEEFSGVHPLLKDFKIPEEDITLKLKEDVKSGTNK
ncbi:MAG: NADH-quinone oxidoreductase subunit C [Fervidicoccaceae archaeon]